MTDSFVTIAKIVKPQGRHGEVAADLHTDFPELFAERNRLFALTESGSRREVELESFWDHKGRVVLKFAGVDSISDAESLIGCEIQIRREERAELEPGTFYISDLKDCAVAVVEGGGEREIGRIADVVFGTGEAPLLVVHQSEDRAEEKSGKEYLIPFAEEYVRSSDFDAKRIVMVLPDGMLELDAPLSADEKRRQQSPQDEND